jgi:23S rRNA pseudouridine2605 synthase
VKVPLARALSKLGLMSRAQAVQRIMAGDVRVGGRTVRDPGYPVIPEAARIAVHGDTIARAAPLTILLHKPRGVVTTRSDPQGRRTVYDLLTGVPTYVAPVGRLDLASTGVLLLTNDTRLSHWLADPANRIVRTYIVTIRSELVDANVSRIERGIRDKGELLRASRVDVLKRSARETHVRVELLEGKNRELRRLFAACGHEVTRLKRIAFGGLELGALAAGQWRIVTRREIQEAFPGAPIRKTSNVQAPNPQDP